MIGNKAGIAVVTAARSAGARLSVFAAALLVGGMASAASSLVAGAILTNFVSATYALPSGAGGFETVRQCTDIYNVTCVQSRWICVSDQPQLCMQAWKMTEPVTQTVVESGNLVCFNIGFCNCGGYSGFNVTVTDAVPANTSMADAAAGPISKIWVNGGYTPLGGPTWANSLAGPWYTTDVTGQIGPLYMRWILTKVGMRKTGYIRYCVTIL